MQFSFSRRESTIMFISLIVYIFLPFLDGVIAWNGILLVPSAGLAVPLGILFGIPAIFGLTSGMVVHHVFQLNFSPVVLISISSTSFLAYLSYTLYKFLIGTSTNSENNILMVVGRVLLITAIVCCGTAAFSAWSYELAGASLYYVVFLYSFVEYLVAIFAVAPFVALLIYSRRFMNVHMVSYSIFTPPTRRSRWLLVLAPLCWATFGIIGSVGFRIRESVPLSAFQRRGLDFLYHYVHPNIFGQGGRRVQVLFGTIMILLIIINSMNNGYSGSD